MKVWITKYALTSGIFEVEARDAGTPGMIEQIGAAYPTYYHGLDWHGTFAGAAAHAEALREKKIKSVERQLANLRALNFEAPNPMRTIGMKE